MNLNPGHLPTYKTLFPVLRTQTGALSMKMIVSIPGLTSDSPKIIAQSIINTDV
jgi:hypothetical protein